MNNFIPKTSVLACFAEFMEIDELLSPPIAFEVDLASTLEAIDTENEQQITLLLSVFSRCFSSNILETYTWPLVEINI